MSAKNKAKTVTVSVYVSGGSVIRVEKPDENLIVRVIDLDADGYEDYQLTLVDGEEALIVDW